MAKQCAAYYKTYSGRQINKDRKSAVAKKWYDKNKDKVRAIAKSYAKTEVGKLTRAFAVYRWQAKERGVRFDLSKTQFESIRKMNCFYCGKEGPSGIDRIDNNIGYTLDNSAPSCYTHNAMKSDMSLHDFIEACESVVKHIDWRIHWQLLKSK